jgi:hypothetical protein
LSRHILPFLRTYRLNEIDYAVLSAYVAADELLALIDASAGIDDPVWVWLSGRVVPSR